MFLIIGSLIKLDILFQNFPHPSYIDYSLQYIYISFIAVALIQLSKNFKIKILLYSIFSFFNNVKIFFCSQKYN